MLFRLPRTATAALTVAFALAAIPACKKKKPPEPDTPSPAPAPGTVTPPGTPNLGGGRDSNAPHSPIFSATAEAPMRAAAANSLKQILLALHNFHDANGALPAGYADATGKPGLSWRVAVLPYLEQDGLFRQFKLNEAWDSPHNKALISAMPTTFAPPRTNTNGYTFYRGFSGPGTWLPPQATPGQPGQLLLGARFTQFRDGLSNTIVVAEAYYPVIWTKPDELAFTPQSVPKLGGVFSNGFMAGMGDGSTKYVKKNVETRMLANAIGIDEGQPVNLD